MRFETRLSGQPTSGRALVPLLLKGRHRSCSSRRAKLAERPAEVRTLEGQDKVPGQIYTVTKDKVECYNSKNPEKPPHPHRWVDANVTCRDWKIRCELRV